MAKRQPKPIETPTDNGIERDYGLYREIERPPYVEKGKNNTVIEYTTIESELSLDVLVRSTHGTAIAQVRAIRDAMRRRLRRVAQPYQKNRPGEWATLAAVDLGDGPKRYDVPLDAHTDRPQGEQAANVLAEVCRLLDESATEREAAIYMRGVYAGRQLEMMHVLPMQPATLQETKRRAGHRQAFEKEKNDKQDAAINLYQALRAEHPLPAKKSPLVTKVAKELQCSVRSAWGYLKGIK